MTTLFHQKISIAVFYGVCTFTACGQVRNDFAPKVVGYGPFSGLEGSYRDVSVTVPPETASIIWEAYPPHPVGLFTLSYIKPDTRFTNGNWNQYTTIRRIDPTPGVHVIRGYGIRNYVNSTVKVSTYPWHPVTKPTELKGILPVNRPFYMKVVLPRDLIGTNVLEGAYGLEIECRYPPQMVLDIDGVREGTSPKTKDYMPRIRKKINEGPLIRETVLVERLNPTKNYYVKFESVGYNIGRGQTIPTGPVTIKVSWHRATLRSANQQIIQGGRETWVVCHGRADNPSNEGSHVSFDRLAGTIAQARLVDQKVTVNALSLDWRTGAADNRPSERGLQGSRFIRSVAHTTRRLLEAKGISKINTSLVGHSWGALVAHDVSRMGDPRGLLWADWGNVARIVAMDPAENNFATWWGPDLDEYDDNGFNFSSRSAKSISIVASAGLPLEGEFGDEGKSKTAHISIHLTPDNYFRDDASWNPFDRATKVHAAPVDAFYLSILHRRTSQISGVIWQHALTAERISNWSDHYFKKIEYEYHNGSLIGLFLKGRYHAHQRLSMGFRSNYTD